MVQPWQPFQSFSKHFEYRELNLMVIEAEIQMPNKIGEIFLKSPHPTVSHQLELECELSVGLGSGWVLTKFIAESLFIVKLQS